MPAVESSIDDIARQWAIRASEGAMPADQQAEMDAWLNASSRHLGAYVRARAVWSRVDRLVAMSPPAAVQPGMPPVAEPATAAPIAPPRATRRRFRIGAIAASVALVVAAGAALLNRPEEQRIAASDDAVYRTVLEDGSRLLLDSGSSVNVRYERSARRLRLERGQASFDVAHNPDVPFVVETPTLRVQAVGTQFSVTLGDPNEAEVLVTEGAVSVQRKDGGEATLVRANQQLVALDQKMTRHSLTVGQIERQSAWQKGLLIFNGETLAAAARAVNRYTHKPVVIADPALAEEKFVGLIRTGNPRSFAEAAAAAFNGSVEERPDVVVISARAAPSPQS